ncbi:Glycosyltransferase [Butyrivibrio fibrisolvens 16/4]|nr:Glycosyltransferase [Butyrivibrio fibrisolvens 16/4]
MKKLAILAPCILPVPASKGGAVEELITCIINQNEISKAFAIDLYTIADSSYSLKSYSCTNIIPILFDTITLKLDKVFDKYYRTVKDKSAKRVFDKKIIEEFLARSSKMEESYFAVIIENQMSMAMELLKATGFSKDYPIYLHMHNDVDIYRSPEYIEFLTKYGVQFIAVSEYIKSQILKYSSDAVVHILKNGIPFDDYSPVRKKPDGKIRFLYAGRVIPTKGVAELIDAFNIMQSKLPSGMQGNVLLDIIGFSDKPTKYEKQIYSKVNMYGTGITCHKRLLTKQMAEKYNEYDIVVMPTVDEEPFGLVALETIAKGLPLITTNSGAIPEVVGDGAVIVDKNVDFISSLAAEMTHLATDEEYRTSLGKKAYNSARRTVEFDINTYYYRLVNILDTKCSQGTISVIVPVYNVENQLERCLQSLISQTYTQLEIILVDDGSADNSGDICEKHAAKDSRIRVIHQENQGLSGARNSGLDVATGEYIFFLDSDDYLDVTTLEKMMAQANRCNADIVACGFAHVYDNGTERPFTSSAPAQYSGREAVLQMMTTNNICSTAWNKLYKADLWKDIRFPVGRLHEDEATTYKLLFNANLVAYLPECLYKYYQRDDSIMNAGLANRYRDYVLACKERIRFFKDNNYMAAMDQGILSLLEYIKYVYRNIDADKKDCIKKLYKDLLKEYGIPASIERQKKLALMVWGFISY